MPTQTQGPNWFRAIVQILASVAILAAGFLSAKHLLATKPKAHHTPLPKMSALVQVREMIPE